MALHEILLTLGVLFVLGLAADEIGRRTWLPRVTSLMVLGVIAGPIGLDLISETVASGYELLATIALTMVAFLLGGTLSRETLAGHGRWIIMISLSVVLVTLVVVAGGLIALGVPVELALVFAAIATATAPAATRDVVMQSGSKGAFAKTVLGIVAVDDAWGLIAFSLILIAVNMMLGNGVEVSLYHGAWELAGAVGLGLAIGFPAAYLTGRIRPGEPMQAEALAVVFLCAGLAVWLGVSFLLTGIVAGAVVVNCARHHSFAFHEIEAIEWPFMIIFFFLAGATLSVEHWQDIGLVGIAFVVLRTLARIAGGWIGARAGGAPPGFSRWMGIALLPQAGVAVGMALVAGDQFPALREEIVAITIAATVFFELTGPICTRIALARAGKD